MNPDDTKIKRLLDLAAKQSGRPITEQRLEQAVKSLRETSTRKGLLARQDLELIAESIREDRKIFASVDLDTINNVLKPTQGK